MCLCQAVPFKAVNVHLSQVKSRCQKITLCHFKPGPTTASIFTYNDLTYSSLKNVIKIPIKQMPFQTNLVQLSKTDVKLMKFNWIEKPTWDIVEVNVLN